MEPITTKIDTDKTTSLEKGREMPTVGDRNRQTDSHTDRQRHVRREKNTFAPLITGENVSSWFFFQRQTLKSIRPALSLLPPSSW